MSSTRSILALSIAAVIASAGAAVAQPPPAGARAGTDRVQAVASLGLRKRFHDWNGSDTALSCQLVSFQQAGLPKPTADAES